MTLSKELAMVRLSELGTSCVDLSTDMIENVDGLPDDFAHFLNRWRALTARLVERTALDSKFEYNADIGVKLMLLEIKDMIEDADASNKKTKILPVASMKVFKDTLDSCLAGLENVKT